MLNDHTDPQLITETSGIVPSLTNSATYPTPTPALPAVSTALATFTHTDRHPAAAECDGEAGPAQRRSGGEGGTDGGRGDLQLARVAGDFARRSGADGANDGGEQYFSGLTPGVVCQVSANAVSSAGASDWSDSATPMVI